jgi:ribosomal protein L29
MATKTAKKPAAKKESKTQAKAEPKTEVKMGGAYSQRDNKVAEKVRNLSDKEMDHRQRELADQLFRLKFQLKMGQTESLNKIRGLRKELARVKTIRHGRALGLEPTGTEKK